MSEREIGLPVGKGVMSEKGRTRCQGCISGHPRRGRRGPFHSGQDRNPDRPPGRVPGCHIR